MRQHLLSPDVAIRHRQILVREAILLVAIALVVLLLQAGGHRVPVLVLDVFLICGGLIGLFATIFLGKSEDRGWFIALAAITMAAGAIQLFWSSGMAVGFLVLIAALSIGDALANLFIIGCHIWLNLHSGK